jgi:hypothetical protein
LRRQMVACRLFAMPFFGGGGHPANWRTNIGNNL